MVGHRPLEASILVRVQARQSMNNIPQEEYYKNLPKKRIGASVLLFNDSDYLLLVKPTYRDGWVIPGGVVDENESPKMAVIRETKEEVGLDVDKDNLSLVCINYSPAKDGRSEGIQFIFYGGVIGADYIKNIKLADGEIEDFKFVPVNKASEILIPGLKERMPLCVEAIKNNKVIYLES